MRSEMAISQVKIQGSFLAMQSKLENTHRLIERRIETSRPARPRTELQVLRGLDVRNLIIPLTSFEECLPEMLRRLCSDGEGSIAGKDLAWVKDEFRTT